MNAPTPIDEKMLFSYWMLLWFVIVSGFAAYIMFYSDRGEILEALLQERSSNQLMIGYQREEEIWENLGLSNGFFTDLYSQSKRLFEFPFDDTPQFEAIVEDMTNYGMLIDYRVSYLFYGVSFLPVLLLAAVFDGFMSREIAKKTYSFSSPIMHNIAVNYVLLPSIFLLFVVFFLPFNIHIGYLFVLTISMIFGIWMSIAHFAKRI